MSFMRGIRRAISSSSSLPLHRCYSVRSSTASVSSSFSAPRGFQWRKLVSPHTSPQAIEAFKDIEASVSKLANDVAAIPAAPAAIDWNKWTKSIKSKGTVDALRKQYESTLASIEAAEKAAVQTTPAEIVEFNTKFDEIIAQAESIAKVSEQEAQLLRPAVKELEAWDHEIADGIVPLEEYFERHPGLKQRLIEEYDNGEFLPTEAEQRFAATDINTFKQFLRDGGDLDAGGIVPADRFGDFKPTQIPQQTKEWLNKVYGDLAKDAEVLDFEYELEPYADEIADDHH